MPPFGIFFVVGLLLATIGWGGIALLMVFTVPTLGPRWLFFFLLTLALTGTALPVTAFLNKRFTHKPLADGSTVLRQAIWVAICGDVMAWLSMGRLLNLALGMFLVVGFVLIEFFLRLRERSRWKPEEPPHE
jgi:hypothetical protein